MRAIDSDQVHLSIYCVYHVLLQECSQVATLVQGRPWQNTPLYISSCQRTWGFYQASHDKTSMIYDNLVFPRKNYWIPLDRICTSLCRIEKLEEIYYIIVCKHMMLSRALVSHPSSRPAWAPSCLLPHSVALPHIAIWKDVFSWLARSSKMGLAAKFRAITKIWINLCSELWLNSNKLVL